MAGWEPAPRNEAELARVAEALQQGDDWLIVTHERPDGDAVGSALAVAHILQYLGKRWTFLVPEPLPLRFRFLPLFERAVVSQGRESHRFGWVVAVDCADVHRFDPVSSWIAADARLVNIDHHRTNPAYGYAAWVDPAAAATCELVYHVARQLGVPLGDGLAKCLYTGILTDTGGFVQPNTTRDVHQIAAELLASGVQPYDVAEPALESRSWAQMHLLQMALANLALSQDGRYAVLYVTRDMLQAAGAGDDDVEGLVGFARSIDTVEVGLLFRELQDGRVKVSLRSKRKVDVARIAQMFGGGGHVRAAGCELAGSLDEVMSQVVQRVEEALSAT
ncbi:MAG: bifunctional oligoribonuclease/PAP phosphatase NrnA [Alicyclobacillaceae bacterium]|nr:bifunctional oligoribonuclease/PAP phosphatase NrnA [Alicyclobacillaceae bacterium]